MLGWNQFGEPICAVSLNAIGIAANYRRADYESSIKKKKKKACQGPTGRLANLITDV